MKDHILKTDLEPEQTAPAPAQRHPSPCAAATQPHEMQQTAFEETLRDAKRHGSKIEEHDPNKPKLF